MNKISVLLLLFIISICVWAATEDGVSNNDQVVAVINGKVITINDFVLQMEALPTYYEPEADTNQITPSGQAGARALREIITQQAMLQAAKNAGVFPTEKEVNDQVERRKRLDPNLLVLYTQNGRTEADLRNDELINLAKLNLMGKGLTVTDEDVKGAYSRIKNIPGPIYTPSTYGLRIVITTDKKQKLLADNDLKRGVDFKTICHEYNDSPALANRSESDGGAGMIPDRDYDWIKSNMGKEFADKVKLKALMQITSWVKVPVTGQGGAKTSAWIMARVEKINPSQTKPLSEDMIIYIKQNLIQAKSDKDAFARLLEETRNKFVIEINREPWKSLYKRDQEMLDANK
jgi:hypothetical protein